MKFEKDDSVFFCEKVFGDILDKVVDHISSVCYPGEVFDDDKLRDWARENGYVLAAEYETMFSCHEHCANCDGEKGFCIFTGNIHQRICDKFVLCKE